MHVAACVSNIQQRLPGVLTNTKTMKNPRNENFAQLFTPYIIESAFAHLGVIKTQSFIYHYTRVWRRLAPEFLSVDNPSCDLLEANIAYKVFSCIHTSVATLTILFTVPCTCKNPY